MFDVSLGRYDFMQSEVTKSDQVGCSCIMNRRRGFTPCRHRSAGEGDLQLELRLSKLSLVWPIFAQPMALSFSPLHEVQSLGEGAFRVLVALVPGIPCLTYRLLLQLPMPWPTKPNRKVAKYVKLLPFGSLGSLFWILVGYRFLLQTTG